MHLLYRYKNLWKAPWRSCYVSVSVTFVIASFISSIVSLRRPLSLITKSHREQGLDYREAEQLSWCSSCSNSLWQGWICGLVYYPGGNAIDPIWRMLASSDGISSWIPVKPQHSNPNPDPNQLRSIDFLTPSTPLIIPPRLPAFLESLMPLKNWCSIHARWSKSRLKHSIRFCGIFSKFKTEFYCISFFFAFLKFASCDNQALVGCIPIAAVAVHLNLKS